MWIVKRLIFAVVIGYASWLGMLAVHELGHIMGAWVTGGRVIDVSVPLLGFSQTIVHPNPRELFVVWCGPVLGILIPLGALVVLRRTPAPWFELLKFFAGFCAIANGAYIGLGWIRDAGDAGDLERLGIPIGILAAFGCAGFATGLVCWHRIRAMSLRALVSDDATNSAYARSALITSSSPD